MSFNGVLEGLFVYISPCIHPITCIRGEWSAIIGGTSPVTGFSDKKCLSIHIRDDPPFFITEPHASQSVSSHAISFSVNCNSFFGIETDLAAEGERKKHIFEVSGIEGCEPVEHLLEFVLVLQDHMVTFSPPTKTIFRLQSLQYPDYHIPWQRLRQTFSRFFPGKNRIIPDKVSQKITLFNPFTVYPFAPARRT